jgi:hypothetical protein
MGAYGARYFSDFRAFNAAFWLSLIALLPFTIGYLQQVFWIAYLVLVPIGLANILAFTTLTAVIDSFAYKFVIYVLATGANMFLFGGSDQVAWIFGQVMFLFGLFYILLNWRSMASRLANFGSGDATSKAE